MHAAVGVFVILGFAGEMESSHSYHVISYIHDTWVLDR